MKELPTIFPRIIARGNYFFFTQKGWQLFEGGDYFKWFSLEVVPLEVFCFIVTWNQKTITSNKLNMGFLIVPNLVPWLIVSDQFCWTDWQGQDKQGCHRFQGQGKVRKFFKTLGKIFDIVKVSEKSGNSVFRFILHKFSSRFWNHFLLEKTKRMLQSK